MSGAVVHIVRHGGQFDDSEVGPFREEPGMTAERLDPAQLAEVYSIEQLKARYFRYLDTKAWNQWRSLFSDDLVFYIENSALPETTTPTLSGGDNFVASVSKTLETAVTVHQGHMGDIEFSGDDTAVGVWAMFDWVDDPEKGYAFQGWGHYHEKYRKEADGAWRISELRLTRLRTDVMEPSRPNGERPWPPSWTARSEVQP